MNMHGFKIICLNCNAERDIKIVDTAVGKTIDWLESPKNANHPIMSGRLRLDDQWGFQCACGNNDLLTKQEARQFSNPGSPKPKEINDIVKNLKPDKPKFKMVGA